MGEFYVFTNDGTKVLAKFSTYHGASCFGADGIQYIVAADFSLENFVMKYRHLGAPLLQNSRRF
jgi:hypothetical protein